MEHTASTLAAELKRQIVGQLPSRPLVGGGFHHFELRASVIADVSAEVSTDAFEALLVDLKTECSGWDVDLSGSHEDLTATFTR